LIVAVLTVRSSYLRNHAEPCPPGAAPDTLQWWIAAEQAWRIKTFALDHDIHTYSAPARPGLIELAQANNNKHYGDIIASQRVIELSDCTDQAAVADELRCNGLDGWLEVAEGRFAFWKPDDAEYRTQSRPE
jgi:hypothetical protein